MSLCRSLPQSKFFVLALISHNSSVNCAFLSVNYKEALNYYRLATARAEILNPKATGDTIQSIFFLISLKT
ncbi:MAG: hypothetical protein OXJ52_00535 [Oligoflexia bacterium]|nr:hypothetical protein [Oligoflexia bacterium]